MFCFRTNRCYWHMHRIAFLPCAMIDSAIPGKNEFALDSLGTLVLDSGRVGDVLTFETTYENCGNAFHLR